MLSFNSYYKQLQIPFVIYADFEAITEKVDKDGNPNKRQ